MFCLCSVVMRNTHATAESCSRDETTSRIVGILMLGSMSGLSSGGSTGVIFHTFEKMTLSAISNSILQLVSV